MEPAEVLESPGKYLKAKRESQKLSLKEVSDATRISEAILRAIEEDRYMNLPHLYVKSFLNTYAKCLGLDPSEVILVHQKCVEKLSLSRDRMPKQPSSIQRKGANVRVLVISIFVVLLSALIGYGLFKLLY